MKESQRKIEIFKAVNDPNGHLLDNLDKLIQSKLRANDKTWFLILFLYAAVTISVATHTAHVQACENYQKTMEVKAIVNVAVKWRDAVVHDRTLNYRKRN